MSDNNSYEKNNLAEKFRGFFTLSLFIILSTVLAIILMNLIVTPMAMLAAHNGSRYTLFFKYFIIVLLLLLVITTIARLVKYIKLQKENGLHSEDILVKIIMMSLKSIGISLLTILGTAMLVAAIILIIKGNVFFLHKLF